MNNWMMWKRCNEEIELLRREMRQFLSSLLERRAVLNSEVHELNLKLESATEISVRVKLFFFFFKDSIYFL